ncbi:MAG TPA: RES family NAD+ phosphorylase [Acidobacteriaceae bacterium]|jgi:RES domain-containing protein|nr:RES family NAD+ phosphorylase [Acidobacteriaceae bacterium]
MILWRISNYADLLGLGGMEASARWHTAGRPIVYLAENPSSALLEILVHLEADEDDLPKKYQLLKIEAVAEIAQEKVDPRSLPVGWRANRTATRAVGDQWLEQRSTALLRVPSMITPETSNWLLNPRHADATRMEIMRVEGASYDQRLLPR